MTAVAETFEIRLPGVPVSINAIEGWREQPEAAAPWQQAIAEQLRDQCAPSEPASVTAAVAFSYGDRRGRNVANNVPVLRRALADALIGAGWISDRDQLTVEANCGRGKRPATRITLEVAR